MSNFTRKLKRSKVRPPAEADMERIALTPDDFTTLRGCADFVLGTAMSGYAAGEAATKMQASCGVVREMCDALQNDGAIRIDGDRLLAMWATCGGVIGAIKAVGASDLAESGLMRSVLDELLQPCGLTVEAVQGLDKRLAALIDQLSDSFGYSETNPGLKA